MTRTFSDGHPKVLPACSFLSQYYFYNIFLQKSCRFSLQTLTKFEAAKTGSGVGFLRLTAVCLAPADWQICSGFKKHDLITCQFESSRSCFPKELVSFYPQHVTHSRPIGRRIWVGRDNNLFDFCWFLFLLQGFFYPGSPVFHPSEKGQVFWNINLSGNSGPIFTLQIFVFPFVFFFFSIFHVSLVYFCRKRTSSLLIARVSMWWSTELSVAWGPLLWRPLVKAPRTRS